MASLNLTSNSLTVAAQIAAIQREYERPTQKPHPWEVWAAGYGIRTARAPRPRVGQLGRFRGNLWFPLKPQYTRKTDGVTVPVWGGVERAVLRGAEGSFVRLGSVTRANTGTRTTQRRASELNEAQKRAGFGAVKRGQVFSERFVKGKLKADGSRYKKTDKQLDQTGGTPNGLIQTWATAEPLLSSDRHKVFRSIQSKHAGRVNSQRPFVWGPKIAEEETRAAIKAWGNWLKKVLGL